MLIIYTLQQADQWDVLVRSFAKYDAYYLSGYVRAFQLHGDGEPLLIYYDGSSENIQLRGINVVMKRDIALDKHFKDIIPPETFYDFSTPYGYGGWLIEGEDTSHLFDCYDSWCRKNNIIAEFVRFHPLGKNQIQCQNFYDIVRLGDTVAMNLGSPQLIFDNVSSKNRNVIRKAIKNGVKIYNGRYPEIFDKFRTIYNMTMNKDNANQYYYFSSEFYESILNDLPYNSQIFYAELPNGTIIAAAIMLVCNGRINYHLSGSLAEYSHLAATNLLLYQAAIWGSYNNCDTLFLGGGVGSSEDSLFKFKRAFYKGDLYGFHIGKKIFNNEVYFELLAKRGGMYNQNYFPQYRG